MTDLIIAKDASQDVWMVLYLNGLAQEETQLMPLIVNLFAGMVKSSLLKTVMTILTMELDAKKDVNPVLNQLGHVKEVTKPKLQLAQLNVEMAF